MATGDIIARGQGTVIDQNDATSINAFISSNQPFTQIYSKDLLSYIPNWVASPFLKLTPSIFMSGTAADQIAVAGRIKAGSVAWKRDGVALTANTTNVINASAPFDLTVKENYLSAGQQVRYEFSATFIDPRTNLELPFSASVTFTKIENAGQLICAIAYPPLGTVFKNGDVLSLVAHCDMWRGSNIDAANITYKWGINNGGVFAPKTVATAAVLAATSVVLNDVTNITVGSAIVIAGTTYTASAVNATTKAVTITPALAAAAAVGVAVSCPYYDSDLGAGWGKIDATNTFGGITGATTNEINIPSAAVLNYETFKCVIKDTDSSSSSYNQLVSDIISFSDLSDPISVDIAAPAGFILKNGTGSTVLTAKLWQAGAEIDAAGTIYTYNWKRYNETGVIDGAFSKTGKSITVTDADVTGKATFEVQIVSK